MSLYPRQSPYVCRIMQGRRTHALYGISWFHITFDAVHSDEETEVGITRFNRILLRVETHDIKKITHSRGNDGTEREAVAPVSCQIVKGNLPPNGDTRVNQSIT
jgi:hypothetical protein